MSTIAIIGGRGAIAQQLTALLVERGDRVLSVIRKPEQAEDVRAAGAEPVVLDLETATTRELVAGINGADAIVFAAGAGAGSGTIRKRTVDLGAALHTVDAAKQAGIARLVQISFITAQLPTPADTQEAFAAYWDAKRQADDALRGSGLDWTIVRPGSLTDDPATGRGRVAADLSGEQVRTRRADVARFVTLVLDEPRSAGHDLDIGEGDTPLAEALAAALD